MSKPLDALGQQWRSVPAGSRMMALIAIVGLAITGFFIYQQMNQVDWAVLYANVDDATASDVLAGLDAHGIEYKIEGNGSRILVPRDQLASSRVALAGDGVTAQAVPDGFDEIFSNQGLASSDFEQRVNYERSLEGELARTLLTMEPVAGARVQLSLPEPSIFIGSGTDTAEQPTASVMLSLRRDLTAAEADTIANVIASSVEGLNADQVTIATADGTMLRAAGSETGAASSTGNLQVTRDFEADLSTRLTELARAMTGQPNATVEVTAVLDFTESTVDKEVIDPEKNATTAVHESTETWTGSGGSAGGASGPDGGPTNAGGTDGTYDKSDKTTTYVPGDRTITHSTITTPTVTALSVAVVIPVISDATGAQPVVIDEETLARVLGTAAGIDTERGDAIEVAVVPAVATDTGDLVTDPTSPVAAPAPTPVTLLAAAAAAGAFLMMLVAIVMRRRRKNQGGAYVATDFPSQSEGKAKKGKKNKGKSDAQTEILELIPRIASERSGQKSDRQAVDEIKADLERMLAESPDSLAALLSGWMAK
ncbi:MAG: flagellar M-ring protein FliF [Actinomycetia bacterium]|nr:flagellar M-ring protein FliF [Actinomycetes bacterium]